MDPEERHESSTVVVDRIRKALSGLAGAEVTVEKEKMGPPTGAPLEVEIRGEDVAVLGDLVERAKEAGVVGYMVKPFRESDLVPAIEVARARFSLGRAMVALGQDRPAAIGLAEAAVQELGDADEGLREEIQAWLDGQRRSR